MGLTRGRSQRGQALALFTVAISAITLGAAIVVDGGYGFAQRRAAQNAADFAAMAGTRIVGISLTGSPVGVGTASNVESSIQAALTANGASLVSAQYIDEAGRAMGNVVGASSIPDGSFGVVVEARVDWQPFLLEPLGVTDWLATATATARTPGESLGGGVVPVGIHMDAYEDLPSCTTQDFFDCIQGLSGPLTSGRINAPGQFGWLSFGLHGSGGKCDWESSLGMQDAGCEVNQPFLDLELGPPPETFGCCTEVGLDDSEDKIAGLNGNEWGDLTEYIDQTLVMWAPIWESTAGSGRNAYYNIVGFGAIVFTSSGDGRQHAKWLEGKAVSGLCKENQSIEGKTYCSGPGDTFKIGVTGEVKLIR
ncbi:MAG: hypothetical protein PVH07_10795 [Chloroflexota bacterium]|jgi:hypothetical protein